MSRPYYQPEYISVSKRGFPDNSAKTFSVKLARRELKGFVVRRGGEFFAYRNLCRHLPVPLDVGDGNVFTYDRKYLQCHMHGAVYEIHSGLCVAGPCEGASLEKFEVVEDGDELLIKIPEKYLTP